MAKSLSPWEKKRQELLAEMQPATREVAIDFDKKRMQLVRGTLMIRYDMGRRLIDVTKPEKVAVYGQDAAGQISAFLGLGKGGRTLFYNLLTMAKAFPDRKALEHEVNIPRADGTPLDFSHFLALARVASTEKRKQLLKKVRANNMAVGELDNLVRAEGVQKNTRKGGRHHKDPVTPLAGLQKGISQAQRLSSYLDVLEGKVFGDLSEISPDAVEPRHLQCIEAMKDRATEVENKLEQLQEVIVPVEERIRKILSHKEDGEVEDEREDEEKPAPKAKAKAAPAEKPRRSKAERLARIKALKAKKKKKLLQAKKKRRRPVTA